MSKPIFEKEYNYLNELVKDAKVKRIILEQASTKQQKDDAKARLNLAEKKLNDYLSKILGNVISDNLDNTVMSVQKLLRDGKLRVGDGIVFLKEIKR